MDDTEYLSSGKDKRIAIYIQMLMLNWLNCFISSLHYKYLNRIYILKFCKFKVCYGNYFWMACLKEAVEHSVTDTALLLKALCAVG